MAQDASKVIEWHIDTLKSNQGIVALNRPRALKNNACKGWI
jgi:hypothetical protein